MRRIVELAERAEVGLVAVVPSGAATKAVRRLVVDQLQRPS